MEGTRGTKEMMQPCPIYLHIISLVAPHLDQDLDPVARLFLRPRPQDVRTLRRRAIAFRLKVS